MPCRAAATGFMLTVFGRNEALLHHLASIRNAAIAAACETAVRTAHGVR